MNGYFLSGAWVVPYVGGRLLDVGHNQCRQKIKRAAVCESCFSCVNRFYFYGHLSADRQTGNIHKFSLSVDLSMFLMDIS